ncbi:MAG TPA: tRNA lysidine(34) synthetase TilS, partial [Gemmatimonadales bacterium]|nr:tRNA lysidine(34) synthetase TilS [Gemmatimonadales bacterium]
MDLPTRFRAHLATLPLEPGRALVAVSGGPDSLALLELLARSADVHRQELVVAHVDHGISPASASAAGLVREAAARLGLELELGALSLGPDASETAARAARYAWLAGAAARRGARVVFLAHHADDQTETVLMRALEGSGLAGLAGMRSIAGGLVRPLLPFTRAEVAGFLEAEGLSAWSDPANADPRHRRSWIRSEVLPALRRRVPDVDAKLRRLGRAAARDRSAWDALLDTLPDLDVGVEEEAISVAGAALRGYDSALSEALLMALGRRVGCPIGPVRAARILELVAGARSGAEVPLGAGWRAEVAFGRVRLARAVPTAAEASWTLEQGSGERTWGEWRLRWRPDLAPERQERSAFVAWFEPGALEIRSWRAGDRV